MFADGAEFLFTDQLFQPEVAIASGNPHLQPFGTTRTFIFGHMSGNDKPGMSKDAEENYRCTIWDGEKLSPMAYPADVLTDQVDTKPQVCPAAPFLYYLFESPA